MSRLNPSKLHIRYLDHASRNSILMPRRYTLTHSDSTGDLFLGIGSDYDRSAISSLLTRLMRDEVLAEWQESASGAALHVYCHVSGGLIIGSPGWRNKILLRHMPQVLQALRLGDNPLFQLHPELEQAPVVVHFRATQRWLNRVERWGCLADYRLEGVVA